SSLTYCVIVFFFFQAEDGIRDRNVTGVQTCALPILEAAESEKKSLVEQLDGIIASMKETQEKLTAKEDEIATAENELIQAKVNENDQYESMKMRIKFMYEGGNAQFFEILLESKSITDFLNKAEYVSQLSAYDRDMLEEFQAVVE